MVLAAIALAYVHPLRSYREARTEVAQREAAIVRIEARNEVLAREVARAEEDEYLEREARRLGLVRLGERLYIVTGLEKKARAGLR